VRSFDPVLFVKFCDYGNPLLGVFLNPMSNSSEYVWCMTQTRPSHGRRKTIRKQTQFVAWIETAQKEPVPCTVLDMSLKGARLRAPAVALPNEFTILLEPNSSLKRRCKVAWRRGFTVGVEFVEFCPDQQHGNSDTH
jgi:hypothetical protein